LFLRDPVSTIQAAVEKSFNAICKKRQTQIRPENWQIFQTILRGSVEEADGSSRFHISRGASAGYHGMYVRPDQRVNLYRLTVTLPKEFTAD
jgi:hypothetical protein